jgi:hypothetical protein
MIINSDDVVLGVSAYLLAGLKDQGVDNLTPVEWSGVRAGLREFSSAEWDILADMAGMPPLTREQITAVIDRVTSGSRQVFQ